MAAHLSFLPKIYNTQISFPTCACPPGSNPYLTRSGFGGAPAPQPNMPPYGGNLQPMGGAPPAYPGQPSYPGGISNQPPLHQQPPGFNQAYQNPQIPGSLPYVGPGAPGFANSGPAYPGYVNSGPSQDYPPHGYQNYSQPHKYRYKPASPSSFLAPSNKPNSTKDHEWIQPVPPTAYPSYNAGGQPPIQGYNAYPASGPTPPTWQGAPGGPVPPYNQQPGQQNYNYPPGGYTGGPNYPGQPRGSTLHPSTDFNCVHCECPHSINQDPT